MKNILLVILMIPQFIIAQTAEYVYKNSSDSTYNCYLTILPDRAEIKGLIIRDFTRLPSQPFSKNYPFNWKDLALKNGLAIVYTVSSDVFPQLCYNDSNLMVMDEIINEVITKHKIPKQNIFIGGISASGTRALRYTQFCEEGKSKYDIKINGVFSVDSPLDMERFYNSALLHQVNFKEGMLEEADMMLKVFPEQLGATPSENIEVYRKNSVYSATDTTGGNAKFLLNTSALFFHEPDIDWWIEERGATYYDINSFDIAGLVNFLKLHNHKDVELITTSGKGFDRNGNRKCHSWTIVDEDYLIKWIVERLNL